MPPLPGLELCPRRGARSSQGNEVAPRVHGRPGMRTVRKVPFQVARGEREAQNPRKLDDGIRERLLKGGMKGETVGNRFNFTALRGQSPSPRAVSGPRCAGRPAWRAAGRSRRAPPALPGPPVWAGIPEPSPTWLKEEESSPQPQSLKKIKRKKKENESPG